MTENKAVGKITLLIHTRDRKKCNFSNSFHSNVKLAFIVQSMFTEQLLYPRKGGITRGQRVTKSE